MANQPLKFQENHQTAFGVLLYSKKKTDGSITATIQIVHYPTKYYYLVISHLNGRVSFIYWC